MEVKEEDIVLLYAGLFDPEELKNFVQKNKGSKFYFYDETELSLASLVANDTIRQKE